MCAEPGCPDLAAPHPAAGPDGGQLAGGVHTDRPLAHPPPKKPDPLGLKKNLVGCLIIWYKTTFNLTVLIFVLNKHGANLYQKYAILKPSNKSSPYFELIKSLPNQPGNSASRGGGAEAWQ